MTPVRSSYVQRTRTAKTPPPISIFFYLLSQARWTRLRIVVVRAAEEAAQFRKFFHSSALFKGVPLGSGGQRNKLA